MTFFAFNIATQIANADTSATQSARVTKAEARARQAKSIKNAEALNAGRPANLQKPQAAAWKYAIFTEAARRAAAASALEMARAAEALRIAEANILRYNTKKKSLYETKQHLVNIYFTIA
ncbi:unnamed protein product [Parnassius apollo]|uniref:(apollo) hypothetical protein n=1 Tax=Parnassius apollo TaxID=110799 RepID=A0A8S3XHT6_PARAO|nr:unnamed protein product [Parnassius apollo]